MAAHAYGGLAVIAITASVAVDRASWSRWIPRILASLVIGGAFYLRLLPTFLEGNGRLFRSELPVQIAFEMGGRGIVSVVILWTLAVSVVAGALKKLPLRAAAIAVSIALVTVWAGLAPFDLYDRMFLALTPAFCLAAALGGARLFGRTAPLLLLPFVVWGTLSNTQKLGSDPLPSTAIAAWVDNQAESGLRTCAVGYDGNSVLPYTSNIETIQVESQSEIARALRVCDIVIGDFTRSEEEFGQLAETHPNRANIVGPFRGVSIIWNDRATALRL